MQLRKIQKFISSFFRFIAFALLVNVVLTVEFGLTEKPEQTARAIHDKLYSHEGPELQPEQTLELLKQMKAAREQVEDEKRKNEKSGSKDKDEDEKKKKKPKWIAGMEILIEASDVTGDKCTKEAFWDLETALSYHKHTPNLANYIIWCTSNQFSICKTTIIGNLREKVSKFDQQQMEDLDLLVDSIKEEGGDTSRGLVQFMVRKGKDKDMLDSKKHTQVFGEVVLNPCTTLETELSPELKILETLAKVPEVINQMDEDMKILTKKIEICDYIDFYLDPLSHEVHLSLKESTPKEPSKFNSLMKGLFSRTKQS